MSNPKTKYPIFVPLDPWSVRVEKRQRALRRAETLQMFGMLLGSILLAGAMLIALIALLTALG